jgi:Fe-S-cluster containining protein
MPQASVAKSQLQAGRRLLARPLLPLVRLVQLLYLTGPFARIEEVLEQLREPLATAGVNYPEPDLVLAPHREILRRFETLKEPGAAPATILDEQHQPLSLLEALAAEVGQAILERELEEINSLLCGPCGCTLCCTGPSPEMTQEFFEIPLASAETSLFALPRIDSPASRAGDSAAEPPLLREGRPFYQGEPAIYHWHRGWSLILPRQSRCPQLDELGGCQIYPQRPQVCRRPQIFAYLLEEQPAPAPTAPGAEDSPGPVYFARHKLLAIWDCPYVRTLQDEIARFAEASGLEPVFRANKE